MTLVAATLLSYLLVYKYAFLAAALFTSAVILPLPDNIILLATGAFASQGYFNFWLSFAVALAANVAGDSFDFFLAARLGSEALKKWRVRLPWFVTRTEEYIERHTGLTIFVTRFVGTIDSIVNLLAGLGEVPYQKFLLYDTLGNAVSLFYVLYLGYVLGDNWSAVSGLVSTIGWVLFAAVLVAALVILLWRRGRADMPRQ